MGKQQKKKQAEQQVSSELLNFRFATSPPSNQQQERRGNNNRNKNKRNSQHDRQQYNRSDHDRASARRNAKHAMFHLHSSADHAFILTRKAKQGYSFNGSDAPVSWGSVRAVKFLSPSRPDTTTGTAAAAATNDAAKTTHSEECPICLDSFVCARITKCGHLFCLPCLLRHVHTYTAINVYAHVKCPCCGLPMHVEDVRPVLIETISPPRDRRRMKFIKLHRTRGCSAPFMPQRGHLRHMSPNAAPIMTDADAKYTRFNYVNTDVLQSLLESNLRELDQERQQYANTAAVELLFLQMATDSVKNDLSRLLLEAGEEHSLVQRFGKSTAGMYQEIPRYLFSDNDVIFAHMDQRPRGNSIGSEAEGRTRAISFGSEQDSRPRGLSVGSENESRSLVSEHQGDRHRNRGYSIGSEGSNVTDSKKPRRRQLPKLAASLYLEPDGEFQFYQAEDGQLCFLSKFNMNCLLADFSTSIPSFDTLDTELTIAQRRRLCPMPDYIEGNIVEVEKLHLTPEMRKRMPFLAHIPFYTDISFVEIDLNRILSDETKKKFEGEFAKRRRRRQNKAKAEKRMDKAMKKKEEERINNLKSRFQRIDPNDEFFQFSPDPEPHTLTGDAFGPSITSDVSATTPPAQQEQQQDHLNPNLTFSSVINTPSNVAVTEDAFPTLGSPVQNTAAARASAPPTWGQGWHAAVAAQAKSVKTSAENLTSSPSQSPMPKGKKSKGKKIVLFSTGGQRGGY